MNATPNTQMMLYTAMTPMYSRGLVYIRLISLVATMKPEPQITIVHMTDVNSARRLMNLVHMMLNPENHVFFIRLCQLIGSQLLGTLGNIVTQGIPDVVGDVGPHGGGYIIG